MKRLALIVVPLLLAGCAAPNPWMSPSVPKEQWDRDYSACRRSADRASGRLDDRDDRTPMRDYERAQAKRYYDAELSSCMRGLGYFPAPKK